MTAAKHVFLQVVIYSRKLPCWGLKGHKSRSNAHSNTNNPFFLFVVVTEFAYSQSPKNLRGVVTGLCLSMIGVGFYFSVALVSIVRSLAADWYPENLNTGSLEKFFFLLVGLMLLNFALFLTLAVRYKYVADNDSIKCELKDSKTPNSNKETPWIQETAFAIAVDVVSLSRRKDRHC